MRAEVLAHGRDLDDAPGWDWRDDRMSRALAGAIAVTTLLGVATVTDARRAVPAATSTSASASASTSRSVEARVVVRSVDPAPDAEVVISAAGIEVRPVGEPSTAAARRVAQLVANQVCRNIERPRFRRENGTADGRRASYVVGRSSDTPRKAAGFLLDLTWRDGGYVARVSQAYGGCAGG
ncbi:MAG TPA: hypothetical protein VNA14_09110 [Mycobacteriales bacterium]|nr:hypothetical protein [Mycobacteriales bacterium]